MIRLLAIIIFLFILVNLFLALKAMVTDKENASSTVKALTTRVIASVVLFILIIAITLFTQDSPNEDALTDQEQSEHTKLN